jgi:D-sedoheptulose 7-phosphate isomerase
LLNPLNVLRNNLAESIKAKQELMEDNAQLAAFEAAVETVVRCYRSGGRLYIAGNGGSAADAQHLAAEFVSKLARDRDPLPAEALTVDSSILTAIGNDYGFDKVFSRQIQGKLTKNDVFLGITTSGNSSNILNALEVCRSMRIPTIVFAGKGGGEAKDLADNCILVHGNRTSVIQELHIVLAHTLCECIENELFQ